MLQIVQVVFFNLTVHPSLFFKHHRIFLLDVAFLLVFGFFILFPC